MRRANERAVAATVALVTACCAVHAAPTGARCADGRLPIFLTFDTGTESQAELIHDVLKKHDVRATFFIANEKAVDGTWTLDPAWAAYWKTLASEGHAFGTHTFDHVYFRSDAGAHDVNVRPQFGPRAGRDARWSAAEYCAELDRVGERFRALTGQAIDPLWRAPGGRTSARLVAIGRACGYRHFGWSPAGFLGDELSSERYPNALLLDRALAHLNAGDIVLAHLGIRSRKQPLAPILDPLIAGLKAKGHCFATLRDYPPERDP
jgi:peptidoglycan/xylan/chitin deacetylase (PgdA/CDA1 family)